MKLLKNMFEKLVYVRKFFKPNKTKLNTNCYAKQLTEYELNKMKELNSNIVRFTSGSGIGTGVECLVDDKWVDITDYNSW